MLRETGEKVAVKVMRTPAFGTCFIATPLTASNHVRGHFVSVAHAGFIPFALSTPWVGLFCEDVIFSAGYYVSSPRLGNDINDVNVAVLMANVSVSKSAAANVYKFLANAVLHLSDHRKSEPGVSSLGGHVYTKNIQYPFSYASRYLSSESNA